MFMIVKFSGDGSYEIVPKSWMEGTQKTYWPENGSKKAKDNEFVDRDWKKYKCIIIKEYCKYIYIYIYIFEIIGNSG